VRAAEKIEISNNPERPERLERLGFKGERN
jgi:hypothetical protein